jgi:hypothetical protein
MKEAQVAAESGLRTIVFGDGDLVEVPKSVRCLI